MHPTASSRCLGFYCPRRHLSLLEGSLFALASGVLGLRRRRSVRSRRQRRACRRVLRRRGVRGVRRGGDWGASAAPRPQRRRQWSGGGTRRRLPPRATGAEEEAEDPRGVVEPRSSVGILKIQIEMHVFAPHDTPGYAGKAINVAREVLENDRLLKTVMKPQGGPEDGLSAVAGRTASSSSQGFVASYLQGAR